MTLVTFGTYFEDFSFYTTKILPLLSLSLLSLEVSKLGIWSNEFHYKSYHKRKLEMINNKTVPFLNNKASRLKSVFDVGWRWWQKGEKDVKKQTLEPDVHSSIVSS